MAQARLTYKELLAAMPGGIRGRFLSLGRYVRDLVDEYQDKHQVPKRLRLRGDSLQSVQLAVLVYSLRKFLYDGAFAAEYAVTALKIVDVSGFMVGGTEFAEGNENVSLGRTIAKRLEDAVREAPFWPHAESAQNMGSLVEALTKEALEHAKEVD